MYFIPEAEIRSYNVSQRINQNIKLMGNFHGVLRFDKRLQTRHFMLLNSYLILYAEDGREPKGIKIWKLDQSDLLQFLTDEKFPLRWVCKLIFDLIPLFGFVTRESKSKIEQLKFSFRKIPGIISEIIESDDVTLSIDEEKNYKVLCSSSFVPVITDNLLNPNHYKFRDVTIWDVNKEKENLHCLLILSELQLKETNKYKLVKIYRSNLETCTSDLFVVEKLIFNEAEEIIIIQVRADGMIVLFLLNAESRNIEETITGFENEPRLVYDPGSTGTFFVNNIDFEGVIIVAVSHFAVSHIVKQIKVFSRCG